MVMGYSTDRSPNELTIPSSHKSHRSPLPSPRRLSPTADELFSLPSSSVLSRPDRPPHNHVSTLGSTSELDRNSSSGFSLSSCSSKEDLNESSRTSTFFSASRRNGSHDRNQSTDTLEDLSTSTKRLTVASGSSHWTYSSPAEHSPQTITSASSAILVL